MWDTNRRQKVVSFCLVVVLVISAITVGSIGGVAATADSSPVSAQQQLQVADSDVLYRANAGGAFTTNGEQWSPLSEYQVAGEDETSSHGQPTTVDGSVPEGTPSQVWETERWDPDGGEEMQYEFSVPDGQQVDVRLYFYDGYSGSDSVGDRVFDVSIENQTVLDGFDIIETYGDDTAAMESFTVTSDGTIDVDFAHVTENPQVNAIEVVAAEPQSNTLGGPTGVEFGETVTGDSATETVTVTNLGGDGDPAIDISDVSVSGVDASDFLADTPSQTTLAPGESATIPVTFSPSTVDPKTATLEVSHNGSDSPLTVGLSGEGVSDVPVGFGSSELDLSGVGVDSVDNPTSLQFGPDGRLYVAQQNGIIYAFEVERNGPNDYEATAVETITTIKQDVPNHNDDGAYNAQEIRQVTGITVDGTADQPVVYVSSSDWRIATGNTDPPSQSLDTNSGVVSKLTQTGSGWDHTMLVRGLPRSEENHAPNGLALDEQNGVLYLAEGGHTNMGTPSNFFSNIPEYAYSGAVLSIDLSAVESMAEKDAANTDVPYLYDLPTLAPDQTASDGPFGGLDGDNMAVLEQDSPVQIHAPGFRNPYDVHLTEDGQLYSVDNGPNGGLGGPPTELCTDESQNGGTTYDDNLHYISGEGYYAGHPNPVRANPDYVPGAVYDGYDGSGECEYLVPGQADGALATFGASTNGLTEYTASNFGGAMEGDLLTASFDGNVYRIQLNAQGDDTTEEPTPLLSSGGTLDVTVQGDDGQLPGTVWSAERTDNAVQVFEPADYDGSGDTQCDSSDPDGDGDGDGYTNGDEQAVGTDPCSAGSVPDDYDGDTIPDQLDDDDDNDGLSDSEDPFALDPDNGLSTQLPVELNFNPSETFPNTIPSATGGTDGLGFTGLMVNGQDPYSELYDPNAVFAGGQAQLLSVSEVPGGDAYQDQNDQQYAFQFGADTSDVTEPFTIHTTVAGFPESPESAQSTGLFIGTGDQDNYLKLVVSATDGTGGVQLAKETGGSFESLAQPTNPGVTGSDQATDLYLTVYPGNDTVTASYSLDGGETTIPANVSTSGSETGSATTTVPEGWLSNETQGLAIGVISTSNFASPFSATWEQLSVQSVDGGSVPDGGPVADAGDDQTVDEGTTVELDASGSTGDSLSYSWTQTAGPAVSLSDAAAVAPTVTAPDVDGETTLSFEAAVSDGSTTDTDRVNVTVQDTDTDAGGVVYRVNAGGSSVSSTDGGPDWSADTDDAPSQYVNVDGDNGLQTYSTQDAITLDDSVPSGTPASLFQTERWDADTDESTTDDTEMQWAFPAQQGESYEVRLYVAEIAFESGSSSLPRTFDVTAEGETKLDGYDIIQQYGHDTGAVETFTVTPSDGTIDLAFLHEQENPKINAIEIIGPDPPTPDAETAADITVTGGSSDTDASTYGSGSFSVTNTGTDQIESVTVDLRSTAFPDVVFDPEGTAGDESGKCFTVDSGASQTGLLTAAGACSAPYADPNNGQNGSDGFETLTITFDDFDPGETVTFSADLDPTSIKGAVGTQNSLAGPIGGSDMIGGTVVVESANATVSNDLFTDGSAGGAQSAVTTDAAAAPTVGVEGTTLDATTFDEHAAGAATVDAAQQTVTVTGAVPGETVTLLRIEGELNLDGVPDDGGTPGYDVEAFEANRVLDIEEYTTTADSNGEATFTVALTESTDIGGLNYFVAAVGNSTESGQVSESVILEYAAESDNGPDPVADFENAPTDPDGDGTYEDINGDGSVDVGDAQALFANTDAAEIQANPGAFDFNDDGSVNVGDAQALFADGVEA